MSDIEKSGSFYLGKIFDPTTQKVEDKPLFYESKYFTTHAVCVGMTGSGKTGLGIGILEEAALSSIPAIIIDPKGDLSNLMLTFPHLEASEFKPWVDPAEASRKSQTVDEYAESTAKTWREGLKNWGLGEERINQLKSKVDISIYTPASKAGIPLSILNSFAAPSDELLLDTEALRDRVLTTTSSLLGLIGIQADPIKSREHILISTLIDKSWREKKNLDLPSLIQQIQKPPFEKVGVFDTETFFPQKERQSLAINLNNLLASPGFQAWMEGEALDIQQLLYTKEGKPKLAILTISHLSDSERMFFVTLLLNEVLSWVRRQTGTSNLRALLYMDEIFGFFPPTAMPPSKTPMLTLLKQARAFGLGVMLCTQNPVDLDYKGLANCGTWFIGKLQTERDKARVLEGLNSASNGELDSAALSKMIATVGSRVFILRSVYIKDPVLFQTRWTLSYLRGPMTLPQIQKLMKEKIPQFEKVSRSKETASSGLSKTKPSVPLGVEEFFLPAKQGLNLYTYEPKIMGVGKLHFVDSKNRIDLWQSYSIVATPSNGAPKIAWEQGEDVTSIMKLLTREAPQGATFKELPASLLSERNFSQFSKGFADYLYQTGVYRIYFDPESKLVSEENESEAEFRSRVADKVKADLDQNVKKIRDQYGSKIKILEDKVLRAESKSAAKQTQVGQQKISTFISFITAIIGAIFGRRISQTTISQTGTSIRRAGKISKDQEEAARAEESLSSLQSQLEDLRLERDSVIAKALTGIDPKSIKLETIEIRPRKGDIDIETIAIVWCPTLI